MPIVAFVQWLPEMWHNFLITIYVSVIIWIFMEQIDIIIITALNSL